MEKIQCPICKATLIYAEQIIGEIKCNRCKNIIKIEKEKSEEHAQIKVK